jgi:hypothetical protein
MLYGLDCSYAPNDAQARQMFRLGWRVFGGYIGGPRAAHAWSHDDFARLAAVGFGFVPYYVGRTSPYDQPSAFTYDQGMIDGTDMTIQAGACGFNETQPLTLDAEYGDWQNEPGPFTDYLRGLVSVVNGAGHPCLLYSDPRTISVLGTPDLVDGTIAASYVVDGRKYQRPPWGYFDPTTPPAWSGWQFADNGLIAGVTVDLNSFMDGFPTATFTPT